MDLSEPLVNEIQYKGKKYSLNLSFDVVLTSYKVMHDPLFTDEQRIDFLAELFIKDYAKLNVSSRVEIVRLIFDNVINSNKKSSSDDNTKAFDFFQDASYIYAAFMQDYGIDLTEQRGKLHWHKFIALFSGLSESTKMREIIGIRLRPLPEPTKYNSKEIASIIELKRIYALDISEDEREKGFENGLKRLADALIARGGI